MKSLFCSVFLLLGFTIGHSQGVPELIYYRFDETGTSVTNYASTPVGTNPAILEGGLTQGGTGQFGGGLIGSGISSTTDYLNTGWATSLTGSWTISIHLANITSSSTLFYFFGDTTAGSFRCFTNGVAGPDNLILRGDTIIDVPVYGAAVVAPKVTHFVYDSVANEIRAYLDGVLVNTVPQNPGGPTISGIGPFKVNGYSSNIGNPAGGVIDEFRIYSRALPATEIEETWDQQLPIGPEIKVTGNSIEIESGDITPDAADDTNFDAGGPGLSRSYTIENEGNVDLNLNGTPAVSVSGSPSFTVTTQPASILLTPSETTNFTVTFNPAAAPGLQTAIISIGSDDSDEDPYTFTVQGTGVPETAAPGAGQGLLSVIRPKKFGSTKVGSRSRVQAIEFENLGAQSVNAIRVIVRGTASREFQVEQPGSSTLKPGSTGSFRATFKPRKSGNRRAKVVILSDSRTVSLPLVGRGAPAGGSGHLPPINY